MLMFFVLIVIVAGIIYLQSKFFNSTRAEIEELKSFFPSIDKVALKECTINKSAITDRIALHRVAQNPPQKKEVDEMTSDDVNVSLITTNYGSKGFKDVVIETNKYLCKNVGTSADLGILQDICDKELEVKENSIKRSLNLPLFLGLGGTFIGIIFGIIGFLLDIESLFGTSSSNNEANGLLFLLMGIAAAMCASFVGLVLMVWNTSFNYKKATVGLDTKRNEYFDFLRRELMPTLANSMSSSLNSLKGVLGHFVDKFGKNLDAYADSAELLNENLEKQHLVLTQIQNMGMTRMAKHVTTAFDQLHKSADALNVFYQYQKALNATIHQVQGGVAQIDAIIVKFDGFINTLNSVANASATAIELQQQFKEAIEQHFPTGSEGREVWRKEFDLLLKDAKTVSSQLNNQLAQNTSYVQNFVTDNSRFFTSFDEIRSVLNTLVECYNGQRECYKDLKDEILSLRKDTKDSQRESAELQKSLLEAVKAMTKAVKDLKE